MNDADKLKQLFTEFGIEYTEAERDELLTISIAARSENVDGYSGFYTDFYFDLQGKFKNAGIWE